MINKKIATYEALATRVRENGGIETVPMWVIRDLQEQDRLGTRVIEAIKLKLEAHGLGYYPEDLSTNQSAKVIVVAKDHPLARIFSCLEKIEDDTDERIKKILGDDRPQQLLDRIRVLIGS